MRFVRRNTVIQNVIHLFGIQFFHPFRHHHRGNAVTHQVSQGHLPVAGLALILGIDRFMSEARALTNLVGNGVATVVVAKWVKELDATLIMRRRPYSSKGVRA